MDDENNHKSWNRIRNQRVLLQEQEESSGPGSSSMEKSGFEDSEELTKKSGLRIKLKVGTSNQYSGEESDHDQSSVKEKRVCKVCNKSFSSGRALGGHMRVHAQEQDGGFGVGPVTKNLHNSKQLKDHQLLHRSNVNSNSTTCLLCGKSFPSMKSLFGHMRCHPDREWRGIRPPPSATIKNSSSSTVSDAVAPPKVDDQIDSAATTTITTTETEYLTLDLAQSLRSWSLTAKRGRKSLVQTRSIDPPLSDAAYDLLALSNKQSGHGIIEALDRDSSSKKKVKTEDGNRVTKNLSLKTLKQQIKEEPQLEERDLLSKKLKLNERGLPMRRKDEPENGVGPDSLSVNSSWEYRDGFGEESNDNCEDEEEEEEKHQFTHISGAHRHKHKKKKMKTIKLKDLETVQSVSPMPVVYCGSRYKCTTCNKSFSTHQALGGHRSSHNKGNKFLLVADTEDYSEFAADASAAEEEQQLLGAALSQTQVDSSPPPTPPEMTEVEESRSTVITMHQCKICNKKFATGQALGGHKRCHWISPAVAAPCSSSSVASPEQDNKKMGRKMFDFDLNELPVVEDEEIPESVYDGNFLNDHSCDWGKR
ncbi:PREDICTED: uncharacterized protein LOC104594341 [Nelumbo nucifera]|uniref:Uncharacterized protein LOC104594341 n=2 Tax=Nelumbo nucifera TaxID=4432 RepID=A0A1U7ZGL8_NELNU|nr:PREDICTED: uncharacterized protein LOC104594341 [Nelumbo nucifera]DAD23757.1 TPA_asm: hypothetical protein HUJ06_025220 [Nelumbo nucifera]